MAAETKKKREEEEKKKKEEDERIAKEEAEKALPPEERAKIETKKKAEAEKAQGNDYYKKKDFENALNQARQWLNNSHRYDRQRTHLAFYPDVADLPDVDTLLAQRSSWPADVVRPDCVLDNVEEDMEVEPEREACEVDGDASSSDSSTSSSAGDSDVD